MNAKTNDIIDCEDVEGDELYQRVNAVAESGVPTLKVLGAWVWFLHRPSPRDAERGNYHLVLTNT